MRRASHWPVLGLPLWLREFMCHLGMCHYVPTLDREHIADSPPLLNPRASLASPRGPARSPQPRPSNCHRNRGSRPLPAPSSPPRHPSETAEPAPTPWPPDSTAPFRPLRTWSPTPRPLRFPSAPHRRPRRARRRYPSAPRRRPGTRRPSTSKRGPSRRSSR